MDNLMKEPLQFFSVPPKTLFLYIFQGFTYSVFYIQTLVSSTSRPSNLKYSHQIFSRLISNSFMKTFLQSKDEISSYFKFNDYFYAFVVGIYCMAVTVHF